MIVCNGNAFMAPQCEPALPAVIQIEGDFTEESFIEHMREAFQAEGKEHFETAPPVEVGIKYPDLDGELLTAFMLCAERPPIIDEQPKLAELGITAEPQNPETPQISATPQNPETPVGRDARGTPQIVTTSESPLTNNVQLTIDNVQLTPETPQIVATPETPLTNNVQFTIDNVQLTPESPQIVATPETPQIIATPEAPQIVATPEAPQIAAIPQAPLTNNVQLAIDNVQLTPETPQIVATPESPVGRDAHGTPQAPKPVVTQQTPEAKEFLAKFSEVKLAIENGGSAELTAEQTKPEEPLETLKAWSNLQKAQANIKEMPEEMKELLEQLTVDKKQPTVDEKPQTLKTPEAPVGRDAQDAPKNSETPVGRDAHDTPQASANFEPQPVILEKTELLQLPKQTIAQVSEQILARLATAQSGTTTFEMVLNPVELGKIAVKIVIQATGTAVEITAEKASTAQLLQNSAERIAYALERSDTRLDTFTVNVAESQQKPDYSEQRDNQNSNRGEQEQDSGENHEEEPGISFEELLKAS
jgi:flagellar hook-length control protein FliK